MLELITLIISQDFCLKQLQWWWKQGAVLIIIAAYYIIIIDAFFIYKWLLCKVTGLVFIIIDAYYIIDTFLNRQRAVFIDGTLRQRRNGQLTMSRKKQCQKLHFSLVWRCKMVETHRNKTGTRSSIMSCTRLTRYLPEREEFWWGCQPLSTWKERSFEYEIW